MWYRRSRCLIDVKADVLPITNYVKDSILSMSDKKYKMAKRYIFKLLSGLMLVDSVERAWIYRR